ncbi:MAG: diaminopimelate decarboxylase [Candidatus Omnitrophica bacterium]|nr:diaminopimelate decarboxylase [Candidatus Omnitrophota bacterium]
MIHYPHDFQPKQGELYCERVPVQRIAEAVGTPVYVYSHKTLVGHYRKLHAAFRAVKPLVCFSVKANGNLAILRLLVRCGAGLDIVSGGELFKARRVGCPASRIVYASVGKTPEEIRESLRQGIFCFNVESAPELKAVDEVARRLKRRARVALRLNPDVDAHTHRHITTGVAESKFGIDIETATRLVREHQRYAGVEIIGVHLHIGSQITHAQPFVLAIQRAAAVMEAGRAAGLAMGWINLGGGLGIIYKDERPQTPADFARRVLPWLKRLKVRLILEPGRFIVGNAGVLVTRVLYVKQARRKQFAVVDAGMTELIRPALYDAYHGVVRVQGAVASRNGYGVYDVVGPVCESADVLARDRALGALAPGELLAVLGAGAYGSVMASNYNGRLRPAEVLVRGSRWAVIRKRETLRDLVRQDVIPGELLR